MIGEDGGIQWGALLSYNFALSLLIVTTNVVVLCEYLPQEFPLWGTIKGYCIVLYCIVLYCIVLYCIVLYCIVLYCIVLYCTVYSFHGKWKNSIYEKSVLPTSDSFR